MIRKNSPFDGVFQKIPARLSALLARIADLRWAFAAVFVSQLLLSEWFLWNLLMVSQKYSMLDVLISQPILFLEAGGWAFLIVLSAALFPLRWLRHTLAALGVILSGFLALGEALLLKAYDTVYNPEMCKSIVASDSRESAEFIASISHYWELFLLMIGLLVLLSWGVILFLRRLRPITFAAVGVVCFFLGFGLSITRYRNWQWAYAPARTTTNDRMAWGLLRAVRMGQQLDSQRQSMHLAAEAAVTDTVASPLGEEVNVILVLGESARAASMQCYGYPLPTTPHLSQLAQAGELCIFSNAVSPANATIASTQAMLTYYTNERPKDHWHQYPDLLSVLKRGGYATAWITNQESTGGPWSVQQLFGSAADTLMGNAYRLNKTNDLFLSDSLFYDEQLLPHLLTFDEVAKAQPHKRGLFAVVHLMGSHAGYAHRYPKRFARFGAKDIAQTLSPAQKEVVAQYDNSILYNDYVVSQIMEHYSHSRSLVIYVSDHGEGLFDDPKNLDFVGHAGNALAHNIVKVPFMVYASPKLREAAPQWWNNLQRIKDQPVMTDVLSRSISHLLGIRTRYDQPACYLFESPTPRVRKVIAADGATAVF